MHFRDKWVSKLRFQIEITPNYLQNTDLFLKNTP